jgi:hypothetical protein
MFFGAFFLALVLHSVIAQIGYLVFPELSQIGIRMYFGEEILPAVSVFSTMSLLALYACQRLVYEPLVKAVSISTFQVYPSRIAFPLLTAAHVAALALGCWYFDGQLTYANAADEAFLTAAGIPYKLFWTVFKFTPFTLIVLYGAVRQRLMPKGIERPVVLALFIAQLWLFVFIAAATGSRTDPLAAVIGVLAFEYWAFHHPIERRNAHSPARRPVSRWKFVGLAVSALTLTVFLLTQLEASRGGGEVAASQLEASGIVQALFLKDYYAPFHVLIGAMANEFVDPITVAVSNGANALMFLNVDYLQYYVVELWASGTVTRAASPAMFAFTEGYVAFGWAGWIYNGLVWSLGFALWRSLSRTDNHRFNAIAFAIPLAMTLVVARSQSSYFIKMLYLSYIPALVLYALGSGTRWRGWRRPRAAAKAEQLSA